MNRRRRLTILPLGLLAVGALAVGACGSDDSSTTAESDAADPTATTAAEQPGDSGSGGILISADPGGSLAYEQTAVESAAGKTELTFTNDSQVVHDVVIEQDGSDVAATDRVTAGSTSTKVDLAPGEYTFYCSITGHRLAGMEGALNVK